MSITLYFSKVNINSHIFDIYKDPKKLNKILDLLLIKIKDNIKHRRENLRLKEDGENYYYDAIYRFNNINKLDVSFNYSIVGSIIKDSVLFANNVDEKSGELVKVPVDNSEIIRFYYDIYRETIVFYTTNRFGYNEFNLAFKELLNECISNAEEKYNFEVSLKREGLDITEIESELRSLGYLESLKIEIIPPNPDDEFLEDIQERGDGYLESLKEGNVTSRSILFTSKATDGLNLNSNDIKIEINRINDIQSMLSAKDAIAKGYASVEAENKAGRVFNTNENKPIKDKIDDSWADNMYTFAQTCKDKVLSLFGMS
ncbi:MAG: hypothetical protein K9L17_10320 [Clostridiales bacterium]|nr:hypothetical protein [Clostridiales bacterium]MCF8023076.1 hypothetical protein [Clostridiales bacterium]